MILTLLLGIINAGPQTEIETFQMLVLNKSTNFTSLMCFVISVLGGKNNNHFRLTPPRWNLSLPGVTLLPKKGINSK